MHLYSKARLGEAYTVNHGSGRHLYSKVRLCTCANCPTLFERHERLTSERWPPAHYYRRIDDISETQAAHAYATLSAMVAQRNGTHDYDFASPEGQEWDAGRVIEIRTSHLPSYALVQLLINAAPSLPDDPLASALRRRCGLGVSESSGWLPLVCDFEAPHVATFQWPASRNIESE